MGSGSGASLKSPDRRRTMFMASDAGAPVRALGFSAHQRGRAFALAGLRPGHSCGEAGKQNGLIHRSTDMDHKSNQANRAISTGRLNASLRVHPRPINVVVFHGSRGSSRFEVGFPLRCLQRLSRPYIATLHCGWRHNSSTRGTSIPVLSY